MLYDKYQSILTASSGEDDLKKKITKFDPFLPLIGPQYVPALFANLNPHFPKMLPTKFGSNQFSGFGEEVV